MKAGAPDWGDIEPPTEPERNADDKTSLELSSLEAEAGREYIEDQRTDRQQRITYAGKVYELMVAWLTGVAILLVLSGVGRATGAFELSDSVLISLVAGTSVNVIGTFAVVINYLFRRNGGGAPIDPPRRVVSKSKT